MNISAADIATTGAHTIAIIAGAIIVRGRLVELITEVARLAVKVAEMCAGWASNRDIGKQRDRILDGVRESVVENTRETRLGFERLEQRLGLQDMKIAAFESKLDAALMRIAALEAKP